MTVDLTFFIIIIFQLIGKAHNVTVALYENLDFKGAVNYIQVNYNGRCHNVPSAWENRASSITTGGICLYIYGEKNCEGERRIKLYPGNHYHHQLNRWDFDNSLKSLKACDTHINETNHQTDGNTVAVYEGLNFQGESLYLNVDSCKNLPEAWRKRTSGTITFEKCYKYYTGLNCTGDHIMQFPGTPSHDDFSKWSFANLTTSIGICENEEQVNHTTPLNTGISPPSPTPANANTKFQSERSTSPSSATKDLPTFVDPKTTTTTDPVKDGLKYYTIVAIIIAVVVIVLLLLLICGVAVFFVYFRKRTGLASTGDYQLQLLNQNYIQNFMHGNPLAYEHIDYENADAHYRAQNMPYDTDTYEIPLEYLQIDKKCPLGSGEFGTVSKAIVTSPKFPSSFEVAVKMVKPGADPGFVKALLEELKIMIYLSGKSRVNQHPHIVNLVGACTQRIYQLEPYIILEYCAGGSLDNFLKKHRKTFMNLIDANDQIQPQIKSPYVNEQSIDTLQLIKWSRDIADGMDFLACQKVVHGDLAARNVLLDDKLEAKISDFGLSRQLYQYTYVKKEQTALPWRWMDIESLQDMKFSSQSDVWAFGITLWEVYTLSQMPYPGIMWSPQFITSLKEGFRMSKPKYATSQIFHVISQCWKESPDDRPTFSELRDKLANILDASLPHLYLEVTE